MIRAYLVVDDQGREAVFLDEAKALQYAAEHHGQVFALGVVW